MKRFSRKTEEVWREAQISCAFNQSWGLCLIKPTQVMETHQNQGSLCKREDTRLLRHLHPATHSSHNSEQEVSVRLSIPTPSKINLNQIHFKEKALNGKNSVFMPPTTRKIIVLASKLFLIWKLLEFRNPGIGFFFLCLNFYTGKLSNLYS